MTGSGTTTLQPRRSPAQQYTASCARHSDPELGPKTGDAKAAKIPPMETATDIAVRDHPNSSVIDSIKIESVATAGPCRAKPAQQTQASTTQP